MSFFFPCILFDSSRLSTWGFLPKLAKHQTCRVVECSAGRKKRESRTNHADVRHLGALPPRIGYTFEPSLLIPPAAYQLHRRYSSNKRNTCLVASCESTFVLSCVYPPLLRCVLGSSPQTRHIFVHTPIVRRYSRESKLAPLPVLARLSPKHPFSNHRVATLVWRAWQQLCAGICQGSIQFGTQYGRECWCGPNGEDADYDIWGVSTGCDFECTGDETEICGGGWAMSVYEFGGFAIEGEFLRWGWY